MERFTDFELQQIDNQLINDGTNIQIRKLVDEVKKYKQLEKEIGCPLEVRCKLYDGAEIFTKDDGKWTVDNIDQYSFHAHSSEDSYFMETFNYFNYKLTWWLKADKSE